MLDKSLKEALSRRVMAGEIKPEMDGVSVDVFGWVHEVRDLGKLVFVLVRDVSGKCQVVFRRGEVDENTEVALDNLPSESGVVVKQPKSRLGVEVVGKEAHCLKQGGATPRIRHDGEGAGRP
jgi:nondiscriminating aspartyl-tRNA synthetase